MGWNTAFEQLMGQTVTVKTIAGVSTDGFGNPVYASTGTAYTALVQDKQQQVVTLAGETEVTRTVAWIKTTSTFNASDQFLLPDGTTPPVLAVENVFDEDGLHHAKVSFGHVGAVFK